MAQTKSKLSEVLNEMAPGETLNLASAAGALPAAVKNKVAIEGTSGNWIENCGGLDRAFLVIENSTASEKEVIVAAGENPPSPRKGLGTVTAKMPEKTITVIALESARHLDAAGKLVLTFTAGTTGKIALLTLAKGGA